MEWLALALWLISGWFLGWYCMPKRWMNAECVLMIFIFGAMAGPFGLFWLTDRKKFDL